MSDYRRPFQRKHNNNLHSSFVVHRENTSCNSIQSDNKRKFSHLYTEATSEYEYQQLQSSQIITQYENRIKNLQSGYQRSKQQYEISLKNMYRQKMILLNIISNNQSLVDQFRSAIKLHSSSSFKQIQIKYNIISSGLFHNKLCNQCINNIITIDFQGKSIEKQTNYPVSSSNKHKKFAYAKQYSWAYIPDQDSLTAFRLKAQINKLKTVIEEIVQQNVRKIHEKNKQIQQLKIQLSKAVAPIQKIINITPPKQSYQHPSEYTDKLNQKFKECLKQKDLQVDNLIIKLKKIQILLKQANDKIIVLQLERVNSKFKGKFY